MRGNAYLIKYDQTPVSISLHRLNAQEIVMDYAFECGYETFCRYLSLGYSLEAAMEEANIQMSYWSFEHFYLV